jgi:hemerythrin-like domain-containing protein
MAEPGTYTTEVGDMFAVHQAITGALDAAPTLVGNAGADAERAEVIGSFYANVLEFLHVHHAGEDELLYPILEERCSDEKEMLKRIDAQHALLNEPMDEARIAIAAWRTAPSPDNAEKLIRLLESIDDALRPHLGEEETYVLPVASAWISPEEWGQLPAHALQTFQGDKPWLGVGLIREQLTGDQGARMLERMPPEIQTLWTQQWEPAFASFITEVRAV